MQSAKHNSSSIYAILILLASAGGGKISDMQDLSAMLPEAGQKRLGEQLESAPKARKSVTRQRIVTPTSEKRRIPSSASFTNSPFTSAYPKHAPPPTYVDTICDIVERWPGLEKQVIMREGEKLREIRHRGKSEETVKSGFQNVFSTQSKKENPRIQGWNFGPIDAEGRPTSDKSTCRWLLAGVDPKSVRLWEAPSVPLALGIHESTTARDARFDNDVANDVQEDSPHNRHAVGIEEVEHTPEVPQESVTQSIRGLSEGVGNHSDLQATASYAHESDHGPRLPQFSGGETTRDHQNRSQEPVAQFDDAEKNAFDEWSDRAQGDYWGSQVRRKKNMLSKLRNVEGNMTKLSCRSAQLKESKERDTDQLRDLQEKIQALSERIREQATETEQVHQEQNMASEAASDLRKQIRDIDEKLDQYWAEDD